MPADAELEVEHQAELEAELDAGNDESPRPTPVPLTEPRGGVPAVTVSPEALDTVISALRAETGPVAVDAERASGYRYGQRAYLVQLRRGDGHPVLIDPIALPDLSGVCDAIADAEWVLHAANQDLPCLAEVGLRPTQLFDTELAGRLAGYERVGLGTMAEIVLGVGLAKEHSAADWSRRPLPEPWLRYAALDVEILVDLRNALHVELAAQGKLGWALEEFAAIAASSAPPPRIDPWRRTSGMHRVRSRRQQAIVRALWQSRDREAQRRDIAPGRLLPDSAIIAAALATPQSADALSKIAGWHGRGARRLLPRVWPALAEALALPDSALPAQTAPTDAPPPPSRWAERDPAAAARLTAVRSAVSGIAAERRLPVENLLPPESVRRLAWAPPESVNAAAVATVLAKFGARDWQINLTAEPLAEAVAISPDRRSFSPIEP